MPFPRDSHFRHERGTSTALSTEDTRKHIHPYIKQDLVDSEKVDLSTWVESAFGVSGKRLDQWTSRIGELRWFEDKVIQLHLKDYCKTDDELSRYEPFCGLANHLLSLARGNLPGVPKSNSYPVNNLRFINTSRATVVRIPEHGELGTDRCLDVTLADGKACTHFIKTNKILWADIQHWIELKRVGCLKQKLNREIQSRKRAAATVTETKKATNTRARKGAATTRSRQKAPATQIRRGALSNTANANVRAGSKRPREDDCNVASWMDSLTGQPNKHVPTWELLGKKAALQSGSYALEVLSCTYGTRVCSHSTILIDDRLYFLYYDACGIVYSGQYLSLIEDFEKVAAVFIALASCTYEHFGAPPASIIEPPIPHSKAFPPQKLTDYTIRIQYPGSDKQTRLTLKDPLYAQYVLAGRRTFAYTTVSSPQISQERLMVKFSYQVNTRKPEYEFINIARSAGVGHLPHVHLWADLWKMSDRARRVFFEDDSEKARYEDRTLRMVVYTEYGSIKKLFRERWDLMPLMVEQMVNCLHDLRYKAKMLHRDISVNNIMFQKQGDNYHFILNDFDMAVILKDDGTRDSPSSKHRTGTLPFMAVSLLRDAIVTARSSNRSPTRHLLCHDYESLFWVCIWCILTLFLDLLSQKHREDFIRIAKQWEDSNLDFAQSNKLAISTRPLVNSGLELPEHVSDLAGWFNGWTTLLRAADSKVVEQTCEPVKNFDADTAGGVLTRDNILASLRKKLTSSSGGISSSLFSSPSHLSTLPTIQQEDSSEDTGVPPSTQAEDEQDGKPDEQEPCAQEVAVVAPKRRSRMKRISEEAAAVKAAIMSRLRPRKRVV
ncbi:hypothetical protein EIP86_006691 [Pleurotus ostreatoroseus]|nr:hypothetical protein EIP86_006691 [Pleurotus ostreatoroseus]